MSGGSAAGSGIWLGLLSLLLSLLLMPSALLVACLRTNERTPLARVCFANSLSHSGRADTSMRVSQSCEPESSILLVLERNALEDGLDGEHVVGTVILTFAWVKQVGRRE